VEEDDGQHRDGAQALDVGTEAGALPGVPHL
jgi:hypothetical protein